VAGSSVTTAAVAEDGDVDISDAFKLHSMPTATRKIFLQFQGCITQVNFWDRRLQHCSIIISQADTPTAALAGAG
jgi:hypothetical protein